MNRSKPTAYKITPDVITILINPHKSPVVSWLFYLFILGICILLLSRFGLILFFNDPKSTMIFSVAFFYSLVRVVSFNRSVKAILNQRKRTIRMGLWPSPVIPFSEIKGLELVPSYHREGSFHYALTLREPARILPIMISADFEPDNNTQPEVETELVPAVREMLFGNQADL